MLTTSARSAPCAALRRQRVAAVGIGVQQTDRLTLQQYRPTAGWGGSPAQTSPICDAAAQVRTVARPAPGVLTDRAVDRPRDALDAKPTQHRHDREHSLGMQDHRPLRAPFPGRLGELSRASRGGSVRQDCSFVRSHALSSSRTTPIEGPGRFEERDAQRATPCRRRGSATARWTAPRRWRPSGWPRPSGPARLGYARSWPCLARAKRPRARPSRFSLQAPRGLTRLGQPPTPRGATHPTKERHHALAL